MGLEKPYNGAYQELDGVEKPVNGAYEMCEAVCKPVNGAWEEIWSDINRMLELSNDLTSVFYSAYGSVNSQKSWLIASDECGGGRVTYYAEGYFSNPTFTLDYTGGFSYIDSSGNLKHLVAGNLDIYMRDVDGDESTGTLTSIGSSSGEGSGTFERTLNGEYDRIGYSISFNNWGVDSSLEPQQYVEIWNFCIDGVEYIPSRDCLF